MDANADLLTLFCKRYKCPQEAFEKAILQRCVSPLVWPAVQIILLFRRDYFSFDLELIEDMKKATSFAQVNQLISSYCSTPRQRSFVKLFFHLRVSKRRLKQLAREIFSPQFA